MSDAEVLSGKPDTLDGDPRMDELADELLARAQAQIADPLGPDRRLSRLTKAALERALDEELTGHHGHDVAVNAVAAKPLSGGRTVFATDRCDGTVRSLADRKWPPALAASAFGFGTGRIEQLRARPRR